MVRLNLCVIQPNGCLEALAYLDQVAAFTSQLDRLGVALSVHKNRLVHDAVNLVFGAHAGFDPSARENFACAFVNLEQLGSAAIDATPGRPVTPEYLALLAGSAVIDYDPRNQAVYGQGRDDRWVLPLAPACEAVPGYDPATRTLDVLLYGTMTPRRRQLVDRLAATGASVGVFEQPLYGPERDELIGRAKLVVNCHRAEGGHFEQGRVVTTLALGTPVVTEAPGPHDAAPWLDGAIFAAPYEELAPLVSSLLADARFGERARQKLAAFTAVTDHRQAFAAMLSSPGFDRLLGQVERRPATTVARCINLGSGKNYQLGWLNLDVLASTLPDAVLDLGGPIELPAVVESPFAGLVELREGEVDAIYADNVFEHVPDLPTMLSNCLRLLKPGGKLVAKVPYERSLGAWQDPTHIRAMNENSWLYYTEWSWYLGWFDWRFEIVGPGYTDLDGEPCGTDTAQEMAVVLRKVPTTLRDRMVARTQAPDFGPGIPTGNVSRLATLGR